MLNYSDMPLDRCSNVRKDPIWLKGQLSSQSVWLLVKNNETLFIKNTPQIKFLPYEKIAQLNLTNALFLGLKTTPNHFSFNTFSKITINSAIIFFSC